MLLFPCKDGGLFHFYGDRYISRHKVYNHSRIKPIEKQVMIDSIKNVITSKHFSGMLIIPREIMRYWNYGRQETKAISYDSIIMFSFKGKIDKNFCQLLTQVLWRIFLFGYNDIVFWIKHHGFRKK